MESCNKSALDGIIKKHGNDPAVIISILRGIQDACGYLSREALHYVSQKMNISLSKLFSVATFYSSFSLEPRGKNLVCVCAGTACYVRHGDGVANKLARELKLGAESKTSADRTFSLEKVRCMGCCSVAPAVRVNEDTYGQVTQDAINGILKKYRKT